MDGKKLMDSSCAIAKGKKELPPLVKVPSIKRMDQVKGLEKENKVKSSLGCPRDEAVLKEEPKAINVAVEDLREEEDEKKVESGGGDKSFRETRTKKMRVSKRIESGPGVYF